MDRYAVVYTLLAVFMAALVYVIGMPWIPNRRRDPAYRSRRGKQPRG